ncbi:MAG TPA: SDR family oxidoreductase [Pirellulales bacterium]|jgi:NAD(P)-dependent dehydrogenase (short-subunit alcohol dehydrogenase family)|nr:SDR family oxidoreductase [Pirellulales bacterium]
MADDHLSLAGRVAVVTGGASGIGRATAILLARHGARVFVGDRVPRDENEAIFAELGIVQLACDVCREADVRRLIEAAAETAGGRLHILVNNAGIGLTRQIPDVTEAEWDAVLAVNLKGAFLASKHAIPRMVAADGGSIVNVSSNAGLLPRAHDPVYSISKGAMIALTKSLALCHAGDRIRVNAVCPGPVCDTRMMNNDLDRAADREALAQQFIDASPLAQANRRMITPEEVAAAVVYLATDAAAMVTGTAVAIDGGKSLGVPPRS